MRRLCSKAIADVQGVIDNLGFAVGNISKVAFFRHYIVPDQNRLPEVVKMNAQISLLLLALLLSPPVPGSRQVNADDQAQAWRVEILTVAGLVNVVEGIAQYQFPTGSRRALRGQQSLEKGGRVTTGAGSFVEILLQPGCYLRLAENSELLLLDLTAGNLKFSLLRGDIIFEILQSKSDFLWTQDYYDQLYDLISVFTPPSEVAFSRHGIYRLTVTEAGLDLQVRKGMAVADGYKISDGKRLIVSDRQQARVQPLEKAPHNSEDGFELWSRRRAFRLAEANRELKKEPWYAASRRGNSTLTVPKAAGGKNEPSLSYRVAAVAGQIVFAEEGVEVKRAEGPWQSLKNVEQVIKDDLLRTGGFSLADIMLTPKVFLRLDAQSEMTVLDLTLDAIQLRLEKGAAILEVYESNESLVPTINLHFRQTGYAIRRQGSYRFQVESPATFEARVREGSLEVNEKKIGRGKRVRDDGGSPIVSDYNESSLDSFDLWNRERNEWNVVANPGYRQGLPKVKQNRAALTGVWYRIESLGYFTFMPIPYFGYRSPYGDDYSTTIGRRRRW